MKKLIYVLFSAMVVLLLAGWIYFKDTKDPYFRVGDVLNMYFSKARTV